MQDHDEDPLEPSKSELKRRSRGLQDLGDELVELPATELEALELPDDLRDAIEDARRITSHGARLRQRLYIGKLLRKVEAEPIYEALARRGQQDRLRVQREHEIERWRDRLLSDEADAWTELASLVPREALDPLRALARQARAEQSSRRPPSAGRQLFRRLRDLLADGGD